MILDAVACMQNLVFPVIALAIGFGLWIRYFKKRPVEKDEAKHRFLRICAVISLLFVFWNGISIIRYSPLRESIQSNKISDAYNLKYDMGALRIVGAQLEKYHRNNDLGATLELYTLLVQRDVKFDPPDYGEFFIGTYLTGWYSFSNWVCEELVANGKQIQKRDYEYVDAAYEYEGYKAGVYKTRYAIDPNYYAFEIYVPGYAKNEGWCYIGFTTKENLLYYLIDGGVFID